MRSLLAISIAAGLSAASLLAQSPRPPAKAAPAAAQTYKAPRTPDGHADLQGVWTNNSVTPLTRPRQWADKAQLTDAEVAELKVLVARSVDEGSDAIFGSFIQLALDAKERGRFNQTSYDPTTGNYNQFWMAERDWDTRTSLVTDPPNGQLPAFTPAAQARRGGGGRGAGGGVAGGGRGGRGAAGAGAAAAAQIARGPAGPEDLSLGERCIHFGTPRTAAGYNSTVQIVQAPESVVLLQEMAHDARIVPITGRSAHLPNSVRQMNGDSIGHWEGDSLVVESTNYTSGFQGSTTNVRLVERYTRVSKDYINWEITVNDPDTWVQPWTMMIRLKRSDGQLYEYACHEGNVAMRGMLGGARLEEKEAAEAAAKAR